MESEPKHTHGVMAAMCVQIAASQSTDSEVCVCVCVREKSDSDSYFIILKKLDNQKMQTAGSFFLKL